MTIQNNNNNLSYLMDPTFTMLIDYLSYRSKELKKIMLKKIIEILSRIIMYRKFR